MVQNNHESQWKVSCLDSILPHAPTTSVLVLLLQWSSTSEALLTFSTKHLCKNSSGTHKRSWRHQDELYSHCLGSHYKYKTVKSIAIQNTWKYIFADILESENRNNFFFMHEISGTNEWKSLEQVDSQRFMVLRECAKHCTDNKHFGNIEKLLEIYA